MDGPGIQSFDEGTRLRALRMGLDDAREVLQGIGWATVAYSQQSFDDQRLGNVTWAERINPNFPGVLADLEKGDSVPDRRFDSTPALIDRGTMRQTIRARIVDETEVEVGSNLPYAGVLHAGGESETVTITDAIQKRLYAFIRTSKHPQAPRLSWLLNKSLTGKRSTIKHPARPFVGVTPDLRKDVEETYGLIIDRGEA